MSPSLLLRFYLLVLVLLVVMLVPTARRSETRRRGLTLLVLLHVVVLSLWAGATAWAVVCGLIGAVAAWEVGGGGGDVPGAVRRTVCVIAAVAGGAAVVGLHVAAEWVALAAWTLAVGTLALPAAAVRRPAFAVALALGQIGPCAAVLARLGSDRPPAALLALILLIQLNDAFGYLGGRRYGRTRLFPTISPNKSLEGYAAGAVAVIAGIVLLHSVVPALPRGHALMRGALILLATLVAADVGDLAVSAFKRRLGVKDSGRVLPGHGGALDRFGNILLAAPLFSLLWLTGIR